MKKYISYFSYLGSKYNGVQRQLPRGINHFESDAKTIDFQRINTIQQWLDDALMSIYPRPLAVYTGKSDRQTDCPTETSFESKSNEPEVNVSNQNKLLLKTGLGSRTDKGVHAIENVYNYELHHPHGLVYKPIELTRMLNLYLLRHQCEILIRNTIMVNDTFNVFQATSKRRYIYRMAILKTGIFKGRHSVLKKSDFTIQLPGEESFALAAINGKGHFDIHAGSSRTTRIKTQEQPSFVADQQVNKKKRKRDYVDPDLHIDSYADQFLPINELYRCLAIDSSYAFTSSRQQMEYDWQTIDVRKMQQACQKFVGKHDFDSFRSPYKGKGALNEVVNTQRSITRFELVPAVPSCAQLQLDSQYDLFDWYHFIIEADSFLYRQVRKMVGMIIAVGRGECDLHEIDYLLGNPNYHNWLPEHYMAPAHGLYLQDMEVDETWSEEQKQKNIKQEHDCVVHQE